MHKKNNLIFSLIFIFIIFSVILVFAKGKFINTNIDYQIAQVITPLPEENNTTLFFVGDIMLTRGVERSVLNNFGGDYSKLFENVNGLRNADILLGNLEGDVSDIGNNVGSKYSFRMNPNILPTLKNAGFDIFSFANNHVGDWNISAFKDTIARLEKVGISKTGAGINKIDTITPTIIEKNGIKFGFLGFSDVGPNWIEAKDNTPGILLANDPNLDSIIREAKLKCDLLIVSFHWGEEYKTIHNTRQEKLAHMAIDNGADMVIGHHPHVMEDIEEYKGKPIVYSLGNFIFDQSFSKDTMRGMLFSATFEKNNLIKTEQKIITLNKQFQPEGIFTKEEIRERDDLASALCPTPENDYEDMTFLNIGQEVSLPNMTYIPSKLRPLNTESSTKSICLKKEARDAFELLTKDAKEDGYTIKASSGYRGYEYQKTLFTNAIKNSNKNTSTSIAKAGYSEHQLGTAIDITGKSVNFSSANNSFMNSVESVWLEENAYKYGFIMSYPKGKEKITGYMHEPWHYRYVGVDKAKEIKDRGVTITEYLK
jgi:poly-gamma-glutamate synthesis protein (capsule biosynthesis protein)